MQTIRKICCAVLLAAISLPVVAARQGNEDKDSASAVPVREILQKADEARGNMAGIQWNVTIYVGDKSRNDRSAYEVKARGFDTLATATLPAKDKENKILMVNGNMWFYKPGLSKAVPISRRQKLMGAAAYGDIAATNYADDYAARPLPDETVGELPCFVFDLTARTENATYDRIKYWIEKQNLVGIKAEYYTVSGKKFKSAVMHYGNRVQVDGTARPFISEIDIRNDILAGEHTYLDFENPRIGPLPDYFFNLNLLRR